MSFTVRKAVALPARTTRQGESKYNLGDLEIGDSFFIPGAKKSVAVTLSKNAKRLGIAITTRSMSDYATYDDEGNGVGEKVAGLGVWRVEPKPEAAAA